MSPQKVRHFALTLPLGRRVWILAGAAALALLAMAAAPMVLQDQAFHGFAETRVYFGIPHFGDVVSNAAYLLVGVLGLQFLLGTDGRRRLPSARERAPYVLFFAGVALVAFGSAYYHWMPTDRTLVWDRLAMTVIFVSLFGAFVTDRIHPTYGSTVATPLAIALGLLSMAAWSATGDLRLYRYVELFSIAGVLLTCLLFEGRVTRFRYAALMGFWFLAATICEAFDRAIWQALGGTVSGHTIKHVLAAVATYVVLIMLRQVHAEQKPGSAPASGRQEGS